MQDIGYSIRIMRRNPGTTIFAVVTLALGIGANTAIFSAARAVLNSVAMRSIRESRTLVMIWQKTPAFMSMIAERNLVRLANYREWQSQSRSFKTMTAFSVSPGDMEIGNRLKRVETIKVERNFFNILDIRPALGRVFTEEEAQKAANRVVLLSAEFYKDQFGNDSDLKGKKIRMNGIERTVVGVLPEGFRLPAMREGSDQKRPQVWLPLLLDQAKSMEELWSPFYYVYARLRPGVSLAQARAEMNRIGDRQRLENPDMNKGCGVNVFPIAEEDAGQVMHRSMHVLQFAVGLVLLIACANVANLLLARAANREQEISIRMAIGARRGRIVRLMLGESFLLSILAGFAGLLVALWCIGGISALAPEDSLRLRELRLEPFVFVYTFVVAVLTGIIFGAAPALHCARQNIYVPLSRSGRSISGGMRWMRRGMAIGEIALAVVLLVGAGLMIRSLQKLMDADLGIRTDHLMVTRIPTKLGGAKEDPGQRRAFGNQLLDRVQAFPGVLSASISSAFPMAGIAQRNYEIEGKPPIKDNWLVANITNVTEDYFKTTGMRLVCGRDFTRAETEANEPDVIVVSESFAKLNWPNQDPLGKVVLLPSQPKTLRLPVVGIVANTHPMGPEREVNPEIYLPSRTFTDIYLAVRTEGDPAIMAPALEKTILGIAPDEIVDSFRSMDQVRSNFPGAAEKRFYMFILGSFAGLALVLASLGIYSVLAYLVTLRRRELGVRMAMGAGRREVFRLVAGEGLRLIVPGMIAGLAGGLLLARLMRALVFGINTEDLITYSISAGVIAVVAMFASYLPARRATQIDPMESLRSE